MEIINLQPHNKEWEKKFEKEKAVLSKTLKGRIFYIHHVGSTAVQDILAKPVIDISIECDEFPPKPLTIQKLASIDYEHWGESGVKGRIWFTKGVPRKFNLHYCSRGSEVVYRQIKFRDSLRSNEALRREYEQLKIKNSKGKDIDSAEYALAKTDLINRIVGI